MEGGGKQFDMEIDRDFVEPMGAICPQHSEDESLRQWVTEHATEDECDYCDGAASGPIAVDLGQFAEHVFRCLLLEYGPIDDEGIPYDGREGGYQAPALDTWDILTDEGVATDDEPLQTLVSAWQGQAWVSRGAWWLTEDEALHYGWERFREIVLTERRFWFHLADRDSYEPSATPPGELLPSVGGAIERAGLTRSLGPGELLFRAQTHRPDERLEGAERLGSPPADKAASNRMSAEGISVFYSALDPATAVAEVRNAEVDPERTGTTTGTFEVQRELRIVDLSAIPDPPGLFDSEAHTRPALRFLRGFAHDLSQGVTRDGREHVDYVPTQVVAEWLRYEFTPGWEPIDGVAYRSAQADGVCVALFFGHGSAADPGAPPRPDQPLQLRE